MDSTSSSSPPVEDSLPVMSGDDSLPLQPQSESSETGGGSASLFGGDSSTTTDAIVDSEVEQAMVVDDGDDDDNLDANNDGDDDDNIDANNDGDDDISDANEVGDCVDQVAASGSPPATSHHDSEVVSDEIVIDNEHHQVDDDDDDDDDDEEELGVTEFPLGRVKNVIKLDPDIQLIGQDAVFLLAKSAELFTEYLASQAFRYTQLGKRKTVSRVDLDSAIHSRECLEFLDGTI